MANAARYIWRFVCFASYVVGLFCYALSSNQLIGKWNWWKLFLYTIFCFITCYAIWFANTWPDLNSHRLKANLAFAVFSLTTLYSFFFDKVSNKPDAYSLVSSAAFAIASFTLLRQNRCVFVVDLLYFFCGFLFLQLMKIRLLLGFVGAGFGYFLIELNSSLDARTERENILRLEVHEDEHSVPIQEGSSGSEQVNIVSATQVNSPQPDDEGMRSNSEGMTPPQPSTMENEELPNYRRVSWIKKTANSGMVVSTVITTVMFSAAFSLPGGNNNNTGSPNYLKKSSFLLFALSDSVAMISSSTSILIFLSILISRYAEDDFLRPFPLKLISGLVVMFVSVISMTVAFSSAFIAYYDS